MSYKKSVWSEASATAHFYFPGFEELHVKLEDESDMRKLEKLFDYCTQLGVEQEKQNANR